METPEPVVHEVAKGPVTFQNPEGIEYREAGSPAEAPFKPAPVWAGHLLTVHVGDQIRALTEEAEAALAKLVVCGLLKELGVRS